MAPDAYKEEEILIAKILSAYSDKEKPNFSKLERDYGVSRRKLCRAWNGRPSRSTRAPTNRLLSPDQEKALFMWLEYLDNIGAASTNAQIERSANYLLSKDFTGPGEPPRARKTWIYDFLDRLPEQYVRIVQQPQERERTASEHYGEVERWFIDLKIDMAAMFIRPQNMWNFDETGFIVGKGKPEAIVTAYPKASKSVSSLSSRESITVVEAINAEGKVIPTLLIPKGQVHLEE
jgi:hypothetical protein